MRIFFLLLFLGLSLSGYTQSGSYFLSHYSPAKDKLDNICFQISQREDGIMYFATRNGVMKFDGKSWSIVPGNGPVYTLVFSPDGRAFWGGANGFGKIPENTAEPQLGNSSPKSTRNVFQSLAATDRIYFLSEEKVYITDTEALVLSEVVASEETGAFTGIFEIGTEIYVSTASAGVFVLNNSALTRPVTQPDFSTGVVFSSSMHNKTLFGTADNRIFLIEKSQKPKQLILEDQNYLDRSVVVSGTWVTAEMVALGTLRGGLVFVNVISGKTQEIINYSKGLPDNEIFALFSDKSNSVWAAHEYGFTRIAPYLPFRSFSYYNGLQGSVLCAATFQNTVYTGTSLGLYKLERQNVYEEVDTYVDVPVKRRRNSTRTEEEPATERPAENNEVNPSKKRGFLGLFRRNRQPAVPAATEPEEAPEKQDASREGRRKETHLTQRIKKTERVLRSSVYVYKKVSGIEAKITQLVEMDGKLIAAGLGGTYVVTPDGAKAIAPDPIRYIYPSMDNLLYLSTYDNQVKVLREAGGKWVSLPVFKNLNDQVTYIFEGTRNDLWLCALDKVYRVTKGNDSLNGITEVQIENPNYDELVGIPTSDGCIVVNSNGFYSYQEGAKEFSQMKSLSGEKIVDYFVGNQQIWYKDSHGWKVYGEGSNTKALGLLNLIKDIRHFSTDKSGSNLWIVTSGNELYKYFTDWVTPLPASYPLMLKGIRNGQKNIDGTKPVIKLNQDDISLGISIVQPDFVAPQAIEYRYKINGLEKEWTEWSPSNDFLEIPYLPSGDYSVEVEAKDVFGNVQTLKGLKLSVLPPYWKRWWFYALQVVLFTSLVLLSFRLSTRYRIVSRLLMLLTIILLIQFVETIVGQTFETKTSPVIDFILQVLIAMMVLPLEGFLRNLMLRSLESNKRFSKFIYPRWQGQNTGKD